MKKQSFLNPGADGNCLSIIFIMITVLIIDLCVDFPVFAADELTPVQQLGKMLFFDKRISTPAGMSCGTCHEPAAGFADPRGKSAVSAVSARKWPGKYESTINVWSLGLPVSAGVLPGRYGSRNAQSAAYAAFSPPLYYDPTMRPGIMEGMYVGGLFWDGRDDSLEEQAMEPPLNPLEMHNRNKQEVVAKLKRYYSAEFKAVFGPNALKKVENMYELMAQAIAEYERSGEVCGFDSKYD